MKNPFLIAIPILILVCATFWLSDRRNYARKRLEEQEQRIRDNNHFTGHGMFLALLHVNFGTPQSNIFFAACAMQSNRMDLAIKSLQKK